ncbi:MAG: shikimate kinase [Oscillospiraceae bacterium]|nr:shikimate kinase [Oscillospiraceae bacterium]
MKNIVLVGLSGSGKSTLSEALAKKRKMPFCDTDALVERAAGKSITRIFDEDGEKHFRDMEAHAACEAAALCGAVIATGGGIVLRTGNVHALKKTGVVFYLRKTPEEILRAADVSDRPLLRDDTAARLTQQFKARDKLYRRAADFTIECADPSEMAETIQMLYEMTAEE